MFKVLKVLRVFKGRSKTSLALVAVMAVLGITNPVLLGVVSTAVEAAQAVLGS